MEKIVNKCKVGGGAFQSTLNGGLLNKNFYQTSRLGFTLAEMMVVMLILSIIMAAMAPVMTTRNKLDQSAPWSWATNGSDAYYGIGDAQVAMIGQEEVKPTDDGARLIINSPSTRNHILFKNGDTTNGRLNMSNNSVLLGKTASGQTLGSYSTGLGSDIGPSGTGSVAIGHLSKSTENYAIAQGYDNFVSGLNSIAIGKGNIAREQDSIVLGRSNTVNAQNSIILGSGNEINSNNSIGIGTNISPGQSGIAIGNSSGAASDAEGAIAIGDQSYSGNYGIAIGDQSYSGNYGIAIGPVRASSEDWGIAIGNESNTESGVSIGSYAVSSNGVALGSFAPTQEQGATGDSSIAIGSNPYAGGSNSIAIGTNACKSVSGSEVVCIGKDSGPISTYTGDQNTIYLGNANSTVVIPGNLVVGRSAALNASTGATVFRYNHRLVTLRIWSNMTAMGSEDYAIFDNYSSCSANANLTNEVKAFFDKYNNFLMDNFSYSDRRLKYVGSESTSGLDKIRQLKVFNYTFKKDEKKVPHVGVIAQDLQKVFPNAVKKGVDGFLTIRMEDMFYAMINAIKELDSKISTLEKENKELKAALKQLQENNKKQEARLKALEAKIK